MLSKDAKLIPEPVAPDVPRRSMREGYGEGVAIAATEDPRVVLMCADLTESTQGSAFERRFPDRYIRIGVHEQLLAAAGAGLALAGKIPFIATYATFCPGRAWEMVRTNICINDANVKIVGSHAGLTVGPDGATHQMTEDIAITRCLPNMTVIAPCDAIEARKATVAMAKMTGPCYIRLCREKTPVFTTDATPFEIGKALSLRKGKDVALIACGPSVHDALRAAEALAKDGIEATVIDCHTVKPLDDATILAVARTCGAVVTVEDHQAAGGLGSAVAELLARSAPTPQEFVAVQDRFGESGTAQELFSKFGLDPSHIADAARRAIARKTRP